MNNKTKLNNLLTIDDASTAADINYCKSSVNNDVVYQISDWEEMSKIYKDDINTIFSYDTRKCLSLILDDASEISIHLFKYGMHPKFLKITDETLKTGDNEILMALDNNFYICPRRLPWSIINKFYCDKSEVVEYLPYTVHDKDFDKYAKAEFNGYSRCMYYKEKYWPEEIRHLPAIYYSLSCQQIINNKKFQGYLPATGQLYFIWQYLDIIKDAMTYIGIQCINWDHLWISVNESSENNVWYGTRYGVTHGNKDHVIYNVLPFFKCIN